MTDSEDLFVKKENGVLTLTFNRPSKKNALNVEIFKGVLVELEKARNDNSVKVIYITGGSGDFFTSGNDFNNFKVFPKSEDLMKEVNRVMSTIVNYPKVIVAGVNGIGIGFGFTLLLLVDFVLISDTSLLMVPFMQTLQSPEGGSTLTFPHLFGRSLTSHLLINSGSLTAEDAKRTGLASHVFEKDVFETEAYNYVTKLAQHPLNLLVKYKDMISRNFKENLLKVIEYELEEINKLWNEPEFKNIINKMLNKPKSKF